MCYLQAKLITENIWNKIVILYDSSSLLWYNISIYSTDLDKIFDIMINDSLYLE